MYARRTWDKPIYYSNIMYIHVLITKGQSNTSFNFAILHKSNKVKKKNEKKTCEYLIIFLTHDLVKM